MMTATMTENVDLNETWSQDEAAPPPPALEIARLSGDDTAVVLFTSTAMPVKVHYVDHDGVQGYVVCNGADCVLCRAGKTADERFLLPVYLPAIGRVGVLPISPASRPGALRPQIMPALKSGRRVVLLISKPDRLTFRVRAVDLTDDMDDGAAAVKEFRRRMEAGEVDLTSVYARLDNAGMEAMPGVAAMLKIREGINRGRGQQ